MLLEYSTELRSNTQGKGELTMEHFIHMPVPRNVQDEFMKKYIERRMSNIKTMYAHDLFERLIEYSFLI